MDHIDPPPRFNERKDSGGFAQKLMRQGHGICRTMTLPVRVEWRHPESECLQLVPKGLHGLAREKI